MNAPTSILPSIAQAPVQPDFVVVVVSRRSACQVEYFLEPGTGDQRQRVGTHARGVVPETAFRKAPARSYN